MQRPPLRRLATWLLPALLLLLSACGAGGDSAADTLASYGDVRSHLEGLSLELETLGETILADTETATAVVALNHLLTNYPYETGSADLTRGTFVFDAWAEGPSGYVADTSAPPAPYDLQVVGNFDDEDVVVLVDWERGGEATTRIDVVGSIVEVPRALRVVVRDGGEEIARVDASGVVSAYDVAECDVEGVRLEAFDADAIVGGFTGSASLDVDAGSSLALDVGYGGYGLGLGFEVDVDAEAPIGCTPDDDAMPTRVAATLDLTRPSGTVGVEAEADAIAWRDGLPVGATVAGSLSSDGDVAATLAGSIAVDPETGATEHDVSVRFSDTTVGVEELAETFTDAD